MKLDSQKIKALHKILKLYHTPGLMAFSPSKEDVVGGWHAVDLRMQYKDSGRGKTSWNAVAAACAKLPDLNK